MPYVSQAGTVNFSTNCLFTGNSFIAASLADVPYDSNAITMNTDNLIPGWSDGSAWGTATADPVANSLGWQLASGSNFSFHVTSPYFTNGVRPNVTITASANVPTNGSLTVSYDSTSGMKSGPFNSRSFSVSDARFAAPNGVDIILTASNCNPLVYYVAVYATSNLGVAPPLIPPGYTGSAPVVSFNQQGQTNLVLSGNVGAANGGLPYWLRSTTNLALPMSQWDWVSTNSFNVDGTFSNTLPMLPGITQQFYRLQTP
jgi:hypothetical protein